MNRTQLGIAFSLIAFMLSLVYYFSYFSPDIEDIQISVKSEELSYGHIQFEGFITNTGSADISEATVYVKISNIEFSDEDLNGSYLYDEVKVVKNLKAGETRPVIFRFKVGKDQIKGYPPKYNGGKPFRFTVYFTNYKWRVGVAAIK
jgi:hypothetical protein